MKINISAAILILFGFLQYNSIAQTNSAPCCETPACRQKVDDLVKRIVKVIGYIEPFNKATAKQSLDKLHANDPVKYMDLLHTVNEVNRYIRNVPQDECFLNAIPEDVHAKVFAWLGYFDDQTNPPDFGSAEFCSGLGRRIELSQGSAGFLSGQMSWLGGLHGYLVYTPGKKKECGNKWRIMGGPAYFLKNRFSFVAVSTRLAYRIKDLGIPPFSLGNLNVFGGLDSNLDNFNFLTIGAEAEVGPIAFNIGLNHDLYIGKPGFSIGVVVANKLFKQSK